MDSYYVYCYLDPCKPLVSSYGKYKFEYEPFYIGMGKGIRINQHLSKRELFDENRIKHNNLKVSRIKKIMESGVLPIIIKLEDSLKREDALNIEMELIKSIGKIINSKGPLTNISDGGDGGDLIKYMSPDKKKKMIEKMSESLRNRKYDYKDGTQTHQYSLSGDYIRSFKSASMASKVLKISKHTILDCMNGEKYKSSGGFIFRKYKSDKIDPIEYNYRAVIRIDQEGLIKEYRSSKEASLENGINPSGISSCCRGRYKTSGGFIWKYKN